MFVAISKFVVRNGMSGDVQAAFRARPHQVDQAEGFIRMEVLNPQENRDEFWLITHWQSREHFTRWHRSHEYRDSHKGIPKGLKLVRGATEIRYFDLIAQ